MQVAATCVGATGIHVNILNLRMIPQVFRCIDPNLQLRTGHQHARAQPVYSGREDAN